MRRHPLRRALVALALVAWLLAGCQTGPRWDTPEALTAEQRIAYDAGDGLLTLIRAVNAATRRVDTLRRAGAISAEAYAAFARVRLDFRAWWQPVLQLYEAGGDVSTHEASFYVWQANLLDAYLVATKRGGA